MVHKLSTPINSMKSFVLSMDLNPEERLSFPDQLKVMKEPLFSLELLVQNLTVRYDNNIM